MKTLIYIPQLYHRDRGLWPPTIPSCWYYKWQKEFFNFLKKKPYKVIWKASKNTNLEDPIKYFKAKNIRYSTKNLTKEMKKADIVLIDYPSTPLWDAYQMNKKAICITPFDTDFILDFKNLSIFSILTDDLDKKISIFINMLEKTI